MALAKKNRLKLKGDFELVKKNGRFFNSESFGILVHRDPSLNDGPLFGFLISKRVDKRSVVRNRIKRILSEAVKLNLEKFAPGLKVIFLARRGLINKKTQDIANELAKLSIDKV